MLTPTKDYYIISFRKFDNLKYRRSYEDYEELPETQASEETQTPETSGEEPQPTETPAEEKGE